MERNGFVYKENADFVLRVEESCSERAVDIILTGELRRETADDLQDELTAFAVCGLSLRLDFRGVVYLSYGVQNALLRVQQCIEETNCGDLVLHHLPYAVRKAFESTGIVDCLEIMEEDK